MTSVSDLSVVDIEFLQAARDINKNPENYEKTGNSAYPANTASIKRATDLTDEQVSYRMGGNSNSKGFEKGNKNLIISYDPQVQGSTLGPRSVELTPYGLDILDKAEKRMSRFAGVSKKEFERLENKFEINREREEIVNMIKSEFEDINYNTARYRTFGSDGETIVGFRDNINDKYIHVYRKYTEKYCHIEIRSHCKSEEMLEHRKLNRVKCGDLQNLSRMICRDIKGMLEEIQQSGQ